jgi:hypothetical protein
MMKSKAVLIFCLILLGSCRNNKEERVLKGNEYFPIMPGTVRFYNVDTILFDAFAATIDTIHNVIKEEVMEKIAHAPGDTSYRIELSTYSAAKLDWVPFKSFERKLVDNYAIEKTDNIQQVKLLFPIAEYKTKGSSYIWNTNMFNGKEPVMIKYYSVFKSYNNGINGYNNCVSVNLNKPQTGLVNNIREEVYAKDIGLVYRFTDSTDYLMRPSHLSGYRVFVRLQ